MTPPSVIFTVPGNPVPYPRARVNWQTKTHYTDPKSLDYRRKVARAAGLAVRFDVTGRKPKVRSVPWFRREDCARERHKAGLRKQKGKRVQCDCAWCSARFHVQLKLYVSDKRKRDVDNYAKNFLDAMTGVVWWDDAQVDGVSAARMFDAQKPRAEVEVHVISGAQGALFGGDDQ